MIRLSNIKLNIKRDENEVFSKAKKILDLSDEQVKFIEISKYSIDARKRSDIKYVYSVDMLLSEKATRRALTHKDVTEVKSYEYKTPSVSSDVRPIIIGSGPSGLFNALILIEAGLKPIIIERGKKVEDRKIDVEKLMKEGIFDENSNIVFGEGGAGTFSDGKLTTGIKDDRKKKVIDLFIENNAPKEIKYLTKPHIGTDNLTEVVKNMRNKIIEKGGEFHFETILTDLITEDNKVTGVKLKNKEKEYTLNSDIVCLCVGHSSFDTFKMLYDKGINLEAKPFAIGARIEHKREFINVSQYKEKYDKRLPSADYKLTAMSSDKRNVYTFCMCPGGVVVPSMSSPNTLVVNGMSYYSRKEENSNSAIIVNVTPDDFKNFGDIPCLSGFYFQREIEEKAFINGGSNYFAPVQMVADFLQDKKSENIGTVIPSYTPGYTLADFRQILPPFVIDALKDGINDMDKKIKGFASNDAVLTAVETRSSSPCRILRDDSMQTNVKGLFAVGEGSGYAGGITSSCIDGIKCAENIIRILS